jgi:hypothetical protein
MAPLVSHMESACNTRRRRDPDDCAAGLGGPPRSSLPFVLKRKDAADGLPALSAASSRLRLYGGGCWPLKRKLGDARSIQGVFFSSPFFRQTKKVDNKRPCPPPRGCCMGTRCDRQKKKKTEGGQARHREHRTVCAVVSCPRLRAACPLYNILTVESGYVPVDRGGARSFPEPRLHMIWGGGGHSASCAKTKTIFVTGTII